MKKLSTQQKIVFAMGILGVLIGIYGKFNSWEHAMYFPFFYSGSAMMWIAFLPQKKSCCSLFKRKAEKKS